MMKGVAIRAAALLLIGVSGCTENSALGNDREAHLNPSEPPAERAPASALAEIDADLLKPEPMAEADVASLGIGSGICLFRYTEVGFPVFLYPADAAGPAVVKLNGRLIELPPAGDSAYADGPVRVEINHPEGVPDAGRGPGELILRIEGAPHEHGFRGVSECPAAFDL